MVFPTERLNPAEEKVFKNNLRKASVALESAYVAVMETRPLAHHYPYEDRLYQEAWKAHNKHLETLDDIKARLDDTLSCYEDANPGIAARRG